MSIYCQAVDLGSRKQRSSHKIILDAALMLVNPDPPLLNTTDRNRSSAFFLNPYSSSKCMPLLFGASKAEHASTVDLAPASANIFVAVND